MVGVPLDDCKMFTSGIRVFHHLLDMTKGNGAVMKHKAKFLQRQQTNKYRLTGSFLEDGNTFSTVHGMEFDVQTGHVYLLADRSLADPSTATTGCACKRRASASRLRRRAKRSTAARAPSPRT